MSPEVTEEDLPGAIDKVSTFITSKGGSVTAVDNWGKRKLAYPIHRFREGNYILSQIKLDPQTTAELEANLKMSENILRHLLIRLNN